MSFAVRQAFGQTFRALRTRNYRLFCLGQMISLSGSWMQRLAQAWLVLQLTDSPFALGTVASLQFTPMLLFSLFGGVLADRLPKRRLLVVTQGVMGLQALMIAVLISTGQIQLWHIYCLAALFGLANAFDNPARQAFVMEMVGPADLPNAVALNSSMVNTARILGPAVGGALIATVGIAACFWLNAATYLAIIAALLAMRPAEFVDLPKPARGGLLSQLAEGIRFALRTRDICLAVILLATLGSFGFNFNVVLPLVTRYVLERGPFELGILFSCLGLGSVLTALGLASRPGAGERTLLLGATAFTVLLGLLALSPWLPLTMLLLVLLGGASIVFSATATTRMQLAAPADLRGRIMSLHTLVFIGTTSIGSFTIGALSERFGVQPALSAIVGLCGLGVCLAALYARRPTHASSAPDGPRSVPPGLTTDRARP